MNVSPAELVRQQIESVLPPTYYADLPTVDRVQMLVGAWSRAMEVNQKLEAHVVELEAILSAAAIAFQITQNPAIYPDDHWCNQAIRILNR